MSKKYKLDILISILEKYNIKNEIVGRKNLSFCKIASVQTADRESLVFIGADRDDKKECCMNTAAEFIICDDKTIIGQELADQKCFIIVDNPRLAALKINNQLFTEVHMSGVHPSAVIHNEAIIHHETSIGPNCYIGRCEIGQGCIIEGNVSIYDKVRISSNVRIFAGCVIGAQGIGHILNESGVMENFHHTGGVAIGENSEIYPNATIARGTLDDTIIEKNVIIDSHVHVGHNVQVGAGSIIIAGSVIGGSAVIGENVWIGMGANIIDHVHIGNSSHVGPGSVVIHDLDENTRVVTKGTVILPK